MNKEKLKTFDLHWEVVVRGIQVVKAFDEDDARDQFVSSVELPDYSYDASLEDICLVKRK